MKFETLLFCNLILLSPFWLISQDTPLELDNYMKISSYEDMAFFLKKTDGNSEILSVEKIGSSVLNRNIYALNFSKKG
ncbi:MAG: hypothetical protein IPH57_09340 [Saprospiraceae bacterium]|nr:hypothetical protein [Saprospiraceae bacterium]